MNKLSVRGIWIFWVMVLVLAGSVTADAGIFQYRDKNGNWVFTDTPPDGAPETLEQMNGMVDSLEGARNLKKELYAACHPKNDVDAAAIATVTVTSPVGTGSGFFITDSGYLITNRHVIRGDEDRIEAADAAIAFADERIRSAEKEFDAREKQLAGEKAVLDDMKAAIESYNGSPAERKILEKEYARRLENYRILKQDFESRQAQFKQRKKRYSLEKSDYARQQAIAGLNRNFRITLKNREVLYAYLVRTSQTHDLALLKVDGCITPFIPAAYGSQVFQQEKVWAIGSPLNLADTMKDGTVSGFTEEYIQTNAQIYPGNSGGPLVDEAGRVIGINTLKALTRHYEGMGLAIPIQTALKEFSAELQ